MIPKFKFKTQRNYTKIPNEIIYNNNLSPLAFKLFVFLYGLHESYHPTYKDIIKLGGFSKYGVHRALQELTYKGMIIKGSMPVSKIINGRKTFIKKNVYIFNSPKVWKQVIAKEQ